MKYRYVHTENCGPNGDRECNKINLYFTSAARGVNDRPSAAPAPPPTSKHTRLRIPTGSLNSQPTLLLNNCKL